MTTISNKVNSPDVFSSFREKKFRYAQPPNAPKSEKDAEIGEKYVDRYIKIVKDNPKKFTAAGIATLLLGGTSIFLSKNALRAKLNQGASAVKEKASILNNNAGTRMYGMSYSQFMHGLKLADVNIDRKILADLAMNDTPAFEKLVELSKSKIA